MTADQYPPKDDETQKEKVIQIVNLYKEGIRSYDKLISTQKERHGYSQFLIDLIDGKVDLDNLIINYIMEHLEK